MGGNRWLARNMLKWRGRSLFFLIELIQFHFRELGFFDWAIRN